MIHLLQPSTLQTLAFPELSAGETGYGMLSAIRTPQRRRKDSGAGPLVLEPKSRSSAGYARCGEKRTPGKPRHQKSFRLHTLRRRKDALRGVISARARHYDQTVSGVSLSP